MADSTNSGQFPRKDQQKISSEGGQASGGKFEKGSRRASMAGKKGGSRSSRS